MWIATLDLVIRTEYLDENWQTLSSQPPDPAGQIFADHLSKNLDEYARDFPVFSELQAIAHWTALAHWIHQADLPLEPALWVTQSVEVYDSPKTTPAITVSQTDTKGNITRVMTIWGGVDLSMDISIQPASNAVKSKLSDLIDVIKRRMGIGKREVSQDDIVFGFVSSFGPQSQLVKKIDFEISPPLSLVYTDNEWLLNLPRLKRYGQAENSYFLFQAPSADAPIVLTFAGSDSRNNTPVFINRHAGLRLQEFSDGFVLTKGEFISDGQFSYVENQQAIFDSDGRILSDALDSSFPVNYEYKNGQLINIHHLSDDSYVNLEYNSGNLQKIQATSGAPVQFEYENDRITTIKTNEQVIQFFEYNLQGLLAKEFAPNNLLLRETRYDALGRILFQWQDGAGTLYDWQQGGQTRLTSGSALNFWRFASENDLEELNIALRLAEHSAIEHLVFARQVGNDVVILADKRSFRLPAYLLQNPETFRKKLSGLLDVRPGARVLISTGNLDSISFQSLFPLATPITVETLNEKRVWENLDFLMRPIIFTEQNSALLNGVPLSSELEKVRLPASGVRSWIDINGIEFREGIDGIILGHGFSSQQLDGQKMVEALSTKQSVLLVIAHGDEQKIYQPDGTEFTPDDLSDTQKLAVAAQKPLVILLSCNTGSQLDEQNSFSQKLLELGPRMVVAPNGNVRPEDASEILNYFLQAARNRDPVDAILSAIRKVYPNWLLRKDDNPDGKDYFFQFRTENNPPRKEIGT
jgi:hypothetical protein